MYAFLILCNNTDYIKVRMSGEGLVYIEMTTAASHKLFCLSAKYQIGIIKLFLLSKLHCGVQLIVKVFRFEI